MYLDGERGFAHTAVAEDDELVEGHGGEHRDGELERGLAGAFTVDVMRGKKAPAEACCLLQGGKKTTQRSGALQSHASSLHPPAASSFQPNIIKEMHIKLTLQKSLAKMQFVPCVSKKSKILAPIFKKCSSSNVWLVFRAQFRLNRVLACGSI